MLAIDHWLKVNEFGLMSLGKSDGMVKAITAVLAMSEVRFCASRQPSESRWRRNASASRSHENEDSVAAIHRFGPMRLPPVRFDVD